MLGAVASWRTDSTESRPGAVLRSKNLGPFLLIRTKSTKKKTRMGISQSNSAGTPTSAVATATSSSSFKSLSTTTVTTEHETRGSFTTATLTITLEVDVDVKLEQHIAEIGTLSTSSVAAPSTSLRAAISRTEVAIISCSAALLVALAGPSVIWFWKRRAPRRQQNAEFSTWMCRGALEVNKDSYMLLYENLDHTDPSESESEIVKAHLIPRRREQSHTVMVAL